MEQKLDQRIAVNFSYSTGNLVPSAVPLSCSVGEVCAGLHTTYQGPGGGDRTCPHQGCRWCQTGKGIGMLDMLEGRGYCKGS